MEEPDLSNLQKWQCSAAQSSPDKTSVPKITLDFLSQSERLIILQNYQARSWEYCRVKTCRRSGTLFKLMKCAGCGNVPQQPALYCSRKCQRADWPEHKKLCRTAAVEAARAALRSRIDLRLWQNCNIMALKRKEAFKMIASWAFDQVYRTYPKVNLRERCLSIGCRSSGLGLGNVVPVTFQLQRMVDTPSGLTPALIFESVPTKTGVFQLLVDQVYHEPDYVDVEAYKLVGPQLEQWPWIFATVASMGNYNRELGNARIQFLASVINTLGTCKKTALLPFKAPKNLDNGKVWTLPHFDKWQELFGGVICF